MKILLLGAAGQLGQAFAKHPHLGSFDAKCLSRSDLDICDYDAVSLYFAAFSPEVVINCAAYTAVDAAEANTQLCQAINAEAVAHLARQCRQYNALLIQLSTDYVFDGKKAAAYTEYDQPAPLNVYGMSKWIAEQHIQQHCEKYLILRTSWLFSEYGHNFYLAMRKLAKTGQPVKVIADQTGCPTYAGDVAAAVFNMIMRYQSQGDLPYGTYHLAAGPAVSWYGFALAIFDAMQTEVSLTPISTAQWRAAAVRPASSVLDSSKINESMGIVLPEWQSALIKLTRGDV